MAKDHQAPQLAIRIHCLTVEREGARGSFSFFATVVCYISVAPLVAFFMPSCTLLPSNFRSHLALGTLAYNAPSPHLFFFAKRLLLHTLSSIVTAPKTDLVRPPTGSLGGEQCH